MSQSIITALDIGVESVKILIARKNNSELEFVSLGSAPTEGLTSRGMKNVKKLARSIKQAQEKAEELADKKVKKVWTNVGTARFKAISSHGLVSVSRADGQISQEDIDRVLQAAQTINLSSNKEIIDVREKEFSVDSQEGIRQPLGMKGTRLEVKALLLTVFSPYLKRVQKAVLKAGLAIEDMFITPVAAAESVLENHQKEKGCAVVDIGEGLTKIAVYKEGTLLDAHILKLGSSHITDDIASGQQVELAEADKLKKEKGSCQKPKSRSKKKEVKLKRDLAKVIKPRVQEILEETHKKIEETMGDQDLPAGIILTGGGVKIDGIVKLAKDEFQLPARIGYPRGIVGLENKDPALATLVGLIKLAVKGQETEDEPNWFQKLFRFFLP